MNILNRSAKALLVLAIATAAVNARADALPAFNVIAGPQIGTSAANTWYCTPSCSTTSTRDLWTTNYPPEIVALADALNDDPDLIYQFVRNNIETVPIYGVQKGALGALIDRSGTPFDQAQLMVELLRSAGKTANYLAGTVSMTGAQVEAWLGTKNAAAVRKIFADGGIPADVTGSTDVTTAVVAHIWVQVNIGGTNYVFDPSYKGHDFSAPANLATMMGWSESAFLTAVQAPMASGIQTATVGSTNAGSVQVPYVSNISASTIATQLTGYANTLVSSMKTQGFATQKLEALLGKQDIIPSAGVLRQTSLPLSTTQYTWTGNIPDRYRTKLTLELLKWTDNSVVLTNQLYVDEIYGRRVLYETLTHGQTWTGCNVQLHVDGIAVGPDYVCTVSPGVGSMVVRMSIDHPYAGTSGTYLDLSGTNALEKEADFTSPVAIVVGLGEVSERLQAKLGSEQVYDRTLPESSYFQCGPGGCEPVDKPAQPNGVSGMVGAYSGWLAQYTRMAMIQSRIKSMVHQQHHSLGVAYRRSLVTQTDSTMSCASCWAVGQAAMVLDVDSAISINSKTNNAAEKVTVARALSLTADMLEASQFEQTGSATPGSVAHRFAAATEETPAMKYFLLTSSAWSDDMFPHSSYYPLYPSAVSATSPYLGAGYKVILPTNPAMGPGIICEGTACSSSQSWNGLERGAAFQAFSADGFSMGNILRDGLQRASKGGSSGSPPVNDGTYAPDKSADLIKDQFKDRSRELGVDLATGEFAYTAPEDVSVGQGELPYRLAFQRSFRPGRGKSPGMGVGWTHNLDYRLDMGSSGMEAMGQSSSLTAAAAIVAIYATQQIYAQQPGTDVELLKRWIIAPFIQAWWAEKVRFNVVTYKAGATSKSFVRLPDGSFNPPGAYNPNDGSSYWNLQQTGAPTGYGKKWLFTGISFTLTSPSKDVQTFEGWGRRNPDINSVDFGYHHGWHLTTWTWPQGGSLTFNYLQEAAPHYSDDLLLSVENHQGRKLNLNFTTGVSFWDACALNSVDDNNGHSAVYDCATSKMTSPVGDERRLAYDNSGSCNTISWADRTVRPRCVPRVGEVYEPSSTTTPKVRLAYDPAGRVKTLADPVAIATPEARNPYVFQIADGLRGARVDPAGNSFAVYYDLDGQPTQFTDELQRTSLAKYDGLDRVIWRKSPGNVITEFQYEPRGGVTQFKQTPSSTTNPTVPATIVVNATYDPACGKIKTVTDAESSVTTWTYNSTHCRVTKVQQPSVPNPKVGGSPLQIPTTDFTYISTGAAIGLIDTVTDPTGVVVDMGYDGSGNRTSQVVDPGTSPHIALTKTYGFDAVGNTTTATTGRGNTTTYTYDAARRVRKVEGPAATCMVSETLFQGGLATKVRNAKICSPNYANDTDWQVWLKSYTVSDKIGRDTDPEGNYIDTDYDLLDRVEYLRQYLGASDADRVTRTEYDAAGQARKIYKAWGSDADQITYAEYAYTADGQLQWVKDANGNQTNYAYDGYNRLWRTCWPSTTNCGVTPGGAALYEELAYDNNGNVLSKRNRSGKILSFVFDDLNRETQRNVPANAAGNFARVLISTYDLASRKWDVTADSQTLQHRYNGAGQLISVGDTLLDASSLTAGDVSYSYDASGNRSTVTAVAANTTWTGTYEYDAGERLKRIYNGATNYLQFTAFDPLSRPTGQTYGDGSGTSFGYDLDDDLASITHSYSGGSLSLGYTRNGAHQLISQTASDASFLMKVANTNVVYTANALNQYTQVGSDTLSHDSNGNLTSDGTWTYAYDEENRLRQATASGTTAIYAYDPLSRRRSKSVNGTVTNFVSDDTNELMELSSTGHRQRLYVNGGEMDSRVGMLQDSTSTWSYYHSNHQGSVLFTTAANAIAEQYRYAAYGESDSPASGNSLRYTGRYLDAETGLYYFRARYYSAKLGRFLQTDPVGYQDDVNLYAYVKNDPLNATDPTGKIATADPRVLAAVLVTAGVIVVAAEINGQPGNGFADAMEAVAGVVTGAMGNEAARPSDGLPVQDGATVERPGKTGSRDQVYGKPGDVGDANGDFDSSAVPDTVRDLGDGIRSGQTAGGANITVRPTSDDGRPTVDVTQGNGKQRDTDKFRYGPKPEEKE